MWHPGFMGPALLQLPHFLLIFEGQTLAFSVGLVRVYKASLWVFLCFCQVLLLPEGREHIPGRYIYFFPIDFLSGLTRSIKSYGQ